MKNILMLMIIISLGLSCHRGDHSNEDIHAEDLHADETSSHNRAKVQLTLFTEDTEFFVEFDQFVEGESSNFLVHVTDLETYKAISDGTVKVRLSGTGGSLETSVGVSETPGIFIASLTPERAGSADLCFDHQFAGANQQACQSAVKILDHDDLQEQQGLPTEAGEGIRFTREMAWNSDFMVKEIKPSLFAGTIRASGEIMVVPEEKQNIIARTEGIIRFIKKNLVQGCRVSEGESLIAISGEDMTENNIKVRFETARNRFLESKSEYTRHKILFAEEAISEKEYLRTRSEYFSDSVEYFSLAKSYKDGNIILRSPVDGYLHELKVSEGIHVSAGEQIGTISKDDVLLLRADVPQQYVESIGEIVTCNIRTAYSEKVFSLDDFNGSLITRGSSVAENNHYIPVYFKVMNDGTLLEGAFVEFFLKKMATSGNVVVPVSALMEELGYYFVYVQLSGEQFEKRKIAIRENDGLSVLVGSGLSFGDRVVTRGKMLVKAASMTTVAPGNSHQH